MAYKLLSLICIYLFGAFARSWKISNSKLCSLEGEKQEERPQMLVGAANPSALKANRLRAGYPLGLALWDGEGARSPVVSFAAQKAGTHRGH